MNDDRFRVAGHKYEYEEPVAIAEVGVAAKVTWADAANSPEQTLWLPESLFLAIAQSTSLRHIDIYSQTLLDASDCATLEQELITLEAKASDQDVQLAAKLLREKAHAVVTKRGRTNLLVEGP
ncbi:hypothetical protein [Paraglaciecola hydrolytica]|uniref:Uncharacterized protein n=1 Tax=Paraglaciecola hydrolytica TaxID=1799789 RepID=A0A148KL81_9ALTE|nr:hypothetical protein [Paraglaciecola hydrolytica]KXI27008.1 hypothetical protein AX660_02660 [Paraglaciecola hydrolytica]